MSSKIKRREKEKQKEKEKKKKKKKKRKRKRRKLLCFALKPEHGPRGIRRKSLKPSTLSQLVGSHRLSACYMSGWVRLSELQVLESRSHSKSGVKPEEFVVEKSL